MSRILISALSLGASFVTTLAVASEPAPVLVYTPTEGEEVTEETLTNLNGFLADLAPQIGDVSIGPANATISVGPDFYFLGAEDARAVLEQAWGNPPDESTLGMIFPAGVTPFDDAWGATISFLDDGYVSDADASKVNYDKIMKDLQSSTRQSNEWRKENGYEPVELVGWAEPPTYNAETKKIYWAKELAFGDNEVNTLNYDIRVLGRKGALVIGFVANMNQMDEIHAAAPAVLEMASFDAGSTYAEFDPSVDKKAAYGLAGLVAGAAIAKKTGLIAGLLLVLKKFGVIILAGIAAALGGLKKMLGGNKG